MHAAAGPACTPIQVTLSHGTLCILFFRCSANCCPGRCTMQRPTPRPWWCRKRRRSTCTGERAPGEWPFHTRPDPSCRHGEVGLYVVDCILFSGSAPDPRPKTINNRIRVPGPRSHRITGGDREHVREEKGCERHAVVAGTRSAIAVLKLARRTPATANPAIAGGKRGADAAPRHPQTTTRGIFWRR